MPRKKFSSVSLSKVTASNGREHNEEVFSLEFVSALAKTYRIDEGRIPELQAALAGWADVYHAFKASHDERLRSGTIKKELQGLLARVNELRMALEALHPDTEARFWRPESHVGLTSLPETPVTTSPYGHTIHQVPTGTDEWAVFWIDKARHFESLTILSRYCEDAVLRLKRDAGGAKRSEGLRMWAANVIHYWENGLGRRFTFDAHKDEPLSPGARFCVEAFRPVDSNIRSASLITALRHALELRPRRQLAETSRK
jgi:hypothetical protein